MSPSILKFPNSLLFMQTFRLKKRNGQMTILTMYHLSRNARRRAENRAGASHLIFFVSQNSTANHV